MFSIHNHLKKCYQNSSLDIQIKANYTFWTCLIIIAIFLISIGTHIYEGTPMFKIVGDIIGIALCGISIFYILNRRVQLTSYLLFIGFVIIIFIHNLLNDFFFPEQATTLRLYVTGAQIGGIHLMLGLSTFKQKYMLYSGLLSWLLLSLHALIIIHHEFNWEQISSFFWANYLVCCMGVVLFAVIAQNILYLSEQLVQNSEDKARIIQAQNQKLERLIDERNVELQVSNQDIEQFAYIVSHDLKEPSRMVSSYIKLLKQELHKKQLGKEQPLKEYIGYVEGGSKRMNEMIQSLTTYTRLNKQFGSKEAINLQQVVQDACSNLRILINDHQAQINYDQLPNISGYKVQLIRLFQNLITNAIRYKAPNRVPIISIMASQQEKEWLITVTDNGIGIAEKDQESIFRLFQQGSQTPSTSKSEGTGIGLAICKKIVERHGGKIGVTSTLGEGATFYFSLPQ